MFRLLAIYCTCVLAQIWRTWPIRQASALWSRHGRPPALCGMPAPRTVSGMLLMNVGSSSNCLSSLPWTLHFLPLQSSFAMWEVIWGFHHFTVATSAKKVELLAVKLGHQGFLREVLIRGEMLDGILRRSEVVWSSPARSKRRSGRSLTLHAPQCISYPPRSLGRNSFPQARDGASSQDRTASYYSSSPA